MNRLRDYVGFTIWFAGIGYVAIWPISASGTSGAVFGAAMVCHAPTAFGILPLLCKMPHPLTLSPALHALGFVAAIAVVLRLVCRAVRCVRRPRARVTADLGRIRRAVAPAPRPKPSRPLPRVKPRSQFGLRGVER